MTLPELRPGHKVSALSLPIIPKVEEAFKSYRYVPYTALTHAARSKAYLCGEESSFVFTQDGLAAMGLDQSNEILIYSGLDCCVKSCRGKNFALLGSKLGIGPGTPPLSRPRYRADAWVVYRNAL